MLLNFFIRRWFPICTIAAVLYLGVLSFEEHRITTSFPLQPEPQIGAIYSWGSHFDNQKHYLTAAAHRYLFDLTAGLIVYWCAICYASWVRIGKPAPYQWSRGSYFEPDPKRAQQTVYVIVIGIVISALLASGSLSSIINAAP